MSQAGLPRERTDINSTVQRAVISAIQADDFVFDLPDLLDYSWTQGTEVVPPLLQWNNLAFLGDGIASGYIANFLTRLIPDATPHLYTVIRSALSSNYTYAHIFRKACLLAVCSSEAVIVHKDFIKRGGDFFEAVLGLMMRQKGAEFARVWLESVLAPLTRAAAQAYRECLAFQGDGRSVDSSNNILVRKLQPKNKSATELAALVSYLASSPDYPRPLALPEASSSRHVDPDLATSRSALTPKNTNAPQLSASGSYTRQGDLQAQAPQYPKPPALSLLANDLQSSASIEIIDLCSSPMSISPASSLNSNLSRHTSAPSALFAFRHPLPARPTSPSALPLSPIREWSPPFFARSRAPSPSPMPEPTKRQSPVRRMEIDSNQESPDEMLRRPRAVSFDQDDDGERDNGAQCVGGSPQRHWPLPLERRIRSPSPPPRTADYVDPYHRRPSVGRMYNVGYQSRRAPSPPPRRLPLDQRIRTPSLISKPRRELANRIRSPSPPPWWREYEPLAQSPQRYDRSYRSERYEESRYDDHDERDYGHYSPFRQLRAYYSV